jgi:hypothetical protein
MKRRDLAGHAGQRLHLVKRHDDGAGFERRPAAKNADHGKRAALQVDGIADFLVQAAGEQLAEHDFLLAIAESASLKNIQRGKLEGVGLPAIDQGVDLRRDGHHIDDHRRGDGDLGDALEHRRDALVDRSVEEGFLDDGEVGAGILIHFQPRVLEGTGEAHQRDEGADAHADAAQGERGPQTAAPDISPGESYKRQSHRVGCSRRINLARAPAYGCSSRLSTWK